MNEARFFLFFLYLYEIHNLECEGMTILADPREEFRWQSLQDEENEVEDTSDHVTEKLSANVTETEKSPMPLEDILKTSLRLEENHIFKCGECSNEYKKEGFLKRHIEMKHNSTGSTCEECGKVFSTGTAFEKHKKTHLKCVVCKAESKTIEEARIHKASHTTCSQCGFDFKTKFNLERHIEKFHKDLA